MLIAEICTAFNCSPDVAARQDLVLVQGILDYRNAKQAIGLMNQGATGFDELSKQPHLTDLLLRMVRAQGAGMATIGDIAEQVRARTGGKEEDDE